MSPYLYIDGVRGLPCIRQAKLVLSRLRIVMTIRKMTLVMMLVVEGVVLGFEMRVVVQLMLRIVGWDVGAGFINVSVAGVSAGV